MRISPPRVVLPALLSLLAAACSGGDATVDASPPSPDMAGGDDAFVLGPGEAAELEVTDGKAGARLATPAGTEAYVVVLTSALLDASGATFNYTFTPDTRPPAGAAPRLATGCALSNDPWATTMIPSETPPTGTAPAVGTQRTLKVSTGIRDEAITAQVIETSDHAVVWADVTPAHPAQLDMAFVDQFITDFEQIILPRERTIFGMESDVDGDGRIGLVFTPLTYQTAVAFFTGCDLGESGCPGSNVGEFLYLTPPATIKPPYNTPAAIKEIIAHELSHLIHYNRKVLRNQLAGWPDSAYMIEGVGALAQDVSGFQAGNLYVTVAGLDQIDAFDLGDLFIDGTPYDFSRDGQMRGGAYLFVRWLYDRGGGDLANADGSVTNKGGIAFLRAMLESPDSMITRMGASTQSTLSDVAMDFYTTLALSNGDQIGDAPPTNPCFQYLPAVNDPVTMRQRGANLFAMFHGMMMNGPAIQPVAQADGSLLAGGVEYVELDARAGAGELDFVLSVDAGAMARVRVARIR